MRNGLPEYAKYSWASRQRCSMAKKDCSNNYFFITFHRDSFKAVTERTLSRLLKIPEASTYSSKTYDDLAKQILCSNRTERRKVANIFDVQRYFVFDNKKTRREIVSYFSPLANKRALKSGAYTFGENCGYLKPDHACGVKSRICPTNGCHSDKVYGIEK